MWLVLKFMAFKQNHGIIIKVSAALRISLFSSCGSFLLKCTTALHTADTNRSSTDPCRATVCFSPTFTVRFTSAPEQQFSKRDVTLTDWYVVWTNICLKKKNLFIYWWLYQHMWDLSSLTRNQTHMSCIGHAVLTAGPPEPSHMDEHFQLKYMYTGKDPDTEKDWRQKEKGATEDEMVRTQYPLNGCEFEQTPGDSGGQRSLAHCSPRSHEELETP